ncbi:MAG: hypothetical protein Kow0068_22260 [Marinilabiliales bacterium]
MDYISYSQRQGNTLAADIFADAPYRIRKYNNQGGLNSIPVHFFIHDASGLGSNVELMNIRIKIKNAEDSVFQDVLTFEDYSDSAFQSLIVCRSPDNADLDIQDFNLSGAMKDSVYTINFTSDSHTFPYTTFVDITRDYWWFTLMIPPDKIQQYNDIIDLEVYFEEDWATDDICYLRIFRADEDLPELTKWYRGDVHYHGMFTQNDAEVGLPLDATKVAAKCIGLDWITLTDHSCDFDNYGLDMHSNWQYLGNEVSFLNATDTDFIFIRGMEMSVNNSAGSVVHALIYPDYSSPFGLPYIADAGGDLSSTSVNIDMMLDSLERYNAFCYAAHPFAEGDKLSSVINGSVWNIADASYHLNGEQHHGGGLVVCNDTLSQSDIFSDLSQNLIKKCLYGGQIWNLKNTLAVYSNPENPWNVLYYQGADEFSQLSETDYMSHKQRFSENFNVTKFIWQKGLKAKNSNLSIERWKFFISGGSDSHGSFNYSTTDYFYGVSGNVNDNAPGKISTLVYCPNGMGDSGKNILYALKKGRSVISSGPVIVMAMDTDTLNNKPEILPGADTILNVDDLQNTFISFYSSTTNEFGMPLLKRIVAVTDTAEYSYELPLDTDTLRYSLDDILNNVFNQQIPLNEYFLIYTELQTSVSYNYPEIFKMSSQTFNCITNPVWLRIDNQSAKSIFNVEHKIKVYPNPTDGMVNVSINPDNRADFFIILTDLTGRTILNDKKQTNNFTLDLSELGIGIYNLIVYNDNFVCQQSLIVE